MVMDSHSLQAISRMDERPRIADKFPLQMAYS